MQTNDTPNNIQWIVVMNRLDKKIHKAYRILSRNMQEEDAEAFLNDSRKYTTKAEKEDMNALLSVSVAANLEVYEIGSRNLESADQNHRSDEL